MVAVNKRGPGGAVHARIGVPMLEQLPGDVLGDVLARMDCSKSVLALSSCSRALRENVPAHNPSLDLVCGDGDAVGGARRLCTRFFARFTCLQRLDLSAAGLCDVSALGGCAPSLRRLDLSGNPDLCDVSVLARCTGLQELLLLCTGVSDVTPLRGCAASLRLLVLVDTRVTDRSLYEMASQVPGGFPKLRMLDLCSTSVTDLAPVLRRCPALRLLRADFTGVSDLAPVPECCPALAELHLSRTAVSDVSPLARCPALAKLDLAYTAVCDVSPLARCPALAKLDLAHTAVSDAVPQIVRQQGPGWLPVRPLRHATPTGLTA